MAINPIARPEIPPLENGDRLTREEFHRRYLAMPEDVQAELIEGIVYLASPVRTDVHAEPHGFLTTWLGVYCIGHPGVRLGDNGTLLLDATNEPQPDAFIRYDNGRSRMTARGYIEGAPELAAEVSASTVSQDATSKKAVYARNGVIEYIVWRVLENALDWFVLRDGQYELLAPDDAGVIRSETFPGLQLNVPALLAGDYATVVTEQFAANSGS